MAGNYITFLQNANVAQPSQLTALLAEKKGGFLSRKTQSGKKPYRKSTQ